MPGSLIDDTFWDRAEMTRHFCKRWLRKAARYQPSRLDGAFDKFFTLFVAFNRLYFHTAQAVGQSDQGDRLMATQLFPLAIGHDLLWQSLVRDGRMPDLQMLARLIGPNGSFFLISGADADTPDSPRNADLRLRLLSESPQVAVEAVLEYLYKVRCNMFHGRKAFEPRQLELLKPCLRCLECMVKTGMERIRDIRLTTTAEARSKGEIGSMHPRRVREPLQNLY